MTKIYRFNYQNGFYLENYFWLLMELIIVSLILLFDSLMEINFLEVKNYFMVINYSKLAIYFADSKKLVNFL